MLCQEPESAGIPSDRVELTLVHKQYDLRAEARKQAEASMSEDNGAGESDAEAGGAGGEDDGKEDSLPAADEATATAGLGMAPCGSCKSRSGCTVAASDVASSGHADGNAVPCHRSVAVVRRGSRGPIRVCRFRLDDGLRD